jgi:superfamily I DNA/RNA helicase
VLYLPTKGHFVVLGTAGSGKTTLAILRAAYLGNSATQNNGCTLLVTFNRALVAYLKHFGDPRLAHVAVENYHLFARGYLNSRHRMGFNTICKSPLKEHIIGLAVAKVKTIEGDHPLPARGDEFFAKEIEWIQQHGILSLETYLEIERVGGGSRLDKKSRSIVFKVFEEYLAQLKRVGKLYDWDSVASGVCREFDKDQSPRRYKHVVIDEGQDFSPQMVRSLVKAIPADGSLTFFGDMAQQIYGRRISWKSAGLNVSKVWEFKENYRNTRQIAALGLAISRMPYFQGTPDLVEPVSPKADGPLPALVECSSQKRETELVLGLVTQASKTQTVAILTRTWELAERISKYLPASKVRLDHDLSTWQAGPRIYYGTFHGAKGLEFDTVILPFFSDSNIPDPEQIRAFGSDEARELDGKLVYVGVTRAKTRLIMTFTGAVTELLPTDTTLYQMSRA